MGIFDRFKKSSGDKGHKPPKAKPEENVLDMVKDDGGKTEKKKEVKLKDSTGHAYTILMRPQLSEKTTAMAHTGKYVFRVGENATKPEVRKAVERVYDVHVTAVNMSNVRGKKRRFGRQQGLTVAWKKAVVTLKEGERIEGIVEAV